MVVESDFVSGNERRGDSTPAGAYSLTYKQRNAVLKGANYASPVAFWMPFNGNIGMHDATWRGSFGGSIYKTNGSHGCINLPPAVAMKIFENIEKGMPVLCYHLPGTESGSTTTGRSYGTAPAPAVSAADLAPAVTPPVETAPVEVPAETAEGQPGEGETSGEQSTESQQPSGPVGPGESGGSVGPSGPGESGGSAGPSGPEQSGGGQDAGGADAGQSSGQESGPSGPGTDSGSQGGGPAGPGL